MVSTPIETERVIPELEELIEQSQQHQAETFPSEIHRLDAVSIETIHGIEVRYQHTDDGNEKLVENDTATGDADIPLAYVCSCGDTLYTEDDAITHLLERIKTELIQRLQEHDATEADSAVPYGEVVHTYAGLSSSRSITRRLIQEDDNPITPVDGSRQPDLYLTE